MLRCSRTAVDITKRVAKSRERCLLARSLRCLILRGLSWRAIAAAHAQNDKNNDADKDHRQFVNRRGECWVHSASVYAEGMRKVQRWVSGKKRCFGVYRIADHIGTGTTILWRWMQDFQFGESPNYHSQLSNCKTFNNT